MKILPGLNAAAPALVMAAGTATMFAADTPLYVKQGGACLLATAVILADLQSGKKLGYTDKIVRAMRKIPGLEKADEGEILGTLCLATCAFLGGGPLAEMTVTGPTVAGNINQFYNYALFPVGAAFSFQRTRALLERALGREMVFSYKDADGKEQRTAPISTGPLLQQVAFFAGAVSMNAYGGLLESPEIMYTATMFGTANLLSIARLPAQALPEEAMRQVAGAAEATLAEVGAQRIAPEQVVAR